MKNKILIIAEAGVNHNGNLNNAIKLMQKAKETGADIIKFQTFITENIVTKSATKAKYQLKNDKTLETQFSMLKSLELSFKNFEKLYFYSKKIGIEFLSTAFDLESLIFLKDLGQKRFKIPSGAITNLPYLRKIASFGNEIILSTGMSYLKEVVQAVDLLVKNGTPKNKIVALHCNSEYPTPYEHVNLKAMVSMKKKLKVEVGYSDHTIGNEVPVAAAAMGATIIEKHFTLRRNQKGPDHKVSLEPKEFESMVSSIRKVEKALGDKIKKPTSSEKKNIRKVRTSIVALINIKKGDLFSTNNITVKRPATGISPMQWDKYIGKIAKKNYKKDSLIR